MKWYAAYRGVGEFILISEKTRAEAISKNIENNESHENHEIECFQEYPNFSAAKRSIREGLDEDKRAVQMGYTRLKTIRRHE